MTRVQLLRRVVLLCGHFARNFAYYRAAWDGRNHIRNSDFWRTTSGNSYDQCVLEWCKLFGEPKGEHNWGQIVTDKNAFEPSLYEAVGADAAAFEAYRVSMRTYRDKSVAHLDLEPVANLPHLDVAQRSVWFYHQYVVKNEMDAEGLGHLPNDIEAYCKIKIREARQIYSP